MPALGGRVQWLAQPSELVSCSVVQAYGTQGVRGAIPSNAWLNFDVELVDVKG